MMLNSVDLPQPDGPITPTNSPGATDSETLSTAVSDAVRRLELLDDVVDDENRLRRPPAAGTASRPDGIATDRHG